MNRFDNRTKKRRFAKCFYDRESKKVQPGLSLTPTQIYAMALQGRPISNFALPDNNFDDGLQEMAEYIRVPLDEKRSIDLNDLFQNQKELETKFKNFRKSQKDKKDKQDQEPKK